MGTTVLDRRSIGLTLPAGVKKLRRDESNFFNGRKTKN
jgi:hypothetical protein